METKNREKILLIVVASIAALYIFNWLAVSPLIDSWHARTDEIAKLKKQIAEGNRQVRYESSTRDEWDFMQANALANNPTVAQHQIFTAFGRWVKSGGVVLGGIHPNIPDSDTNFTILDCRSDVSGPPDNVSDFLRAMSRDTIASKVESFELTAKDDNGRQLTLGLSLDGLILNDTDPTQVTAPEPKPRPDDSGQDSMSSKFKLIALNNIFDQNRVGPSRPRTAPTPRPVQRRPDTLTSLGTSIDHGAGTAFFEGTQVRDTRAYPVGSAVGDLMVSRITLKTVTLTNASGNSFVLPTDGSVSLRRDSTGPWHPTKYDANNPAPQYTGSPSTSSSDSTTTTAPSAAPAAGASSIEEMLRKRREQAE